MNQTVLFLRHVSIYKPFRVTSIPFRVDNDSDPIRRGSGFFYIIKLSQKSQEIGFLRWYTLEVVESFGNSLGMEVNYTTNKRSIKCLDMKYPVFTIKLYHRRPYFS